MSKHTERVHHRAALILIQEKDTIQMSHITIGEVLVSTREDGLCLHSVKKWRSPPRRQSVDSHNQSGRTSSSNAHASHLIIHRFSHILLYPLLLIFPVQSLGIEDYSVALYVRYLHPPGMRREHIGSRRGEGYKSDHTTV